MRKPCGKRAARCVWLGWQADWLAGWVCPVRCRAWQRAGAGKFRDPCDTRRPMAASGHWQAAVGRIQPPMLHHHRQCPCFAQAGHKQRPSTSGAMDATCRPARRRDLRPSRLPSARADASPSPRTKGAPRTRSGGRSRPGFRSFAGCRLGGWQRRVAAQGEGPPTGMAWLPPGDEDRAGRQRATAVAATAPARASRIEGRLGEVARRPGGRGGRTQLVPHCSTASAKTAGRAPSMATSIFPTRV